MDACRQNPCALARGGKRVLPPSTICLPFVLCGGRGPATLSNELVSPFAVGVTICSIARLVRRHQVGVLDHRPLT